MGHWYLLMFILGTAPITSKTDHNMKISFFTLSCFIFFCCNAISLFSQPVANPDAERIHYYENNNSNDLTVIDDSNLIESSSVNEICFDNIDNDGNGATDCDDGTCFCPCGLGAEVFNDDFTEPDLEPGWLVYYPAPCCSLLVELNGDGFLNLTLANPHFPQGYQPKIIRPIVTDSDWLIESEIYLDDTANDHSAGIVGVLDPNVGIYALIVNYVEIYRSGGSFGLRSFVYQPNLPGLPYVVEGASVGIPNDNVTVRVAKIGNAVDVYYSLDSGGTWNFLDSEVFNSNIVHEVGMHVANYSQDGSMLEAAFNYFTIKSCSDFPCEGQPMTDWYLDNDGDGFGAGEAVSNCEPPSEDYVAQSGDCDDTNASIYPDATEVCNGMDNDCDGLIGNDDPDNEGSCSDTEICDDGMDNDGDGLIDGDDPDCSQGCPMSVNLNTWNQEGNSGAGNWAVAPDGQSVTQTINEAPTFYVGPDVYSNAVIEGTIEVNTAQDDDFIGFVFGYQDPIGMGSDDYHFWLFDWKKEAQTVSGDFADEGMTLSKITLTDFDINVEPERKKYFWRHDDDLGKHATLGTNLGNGTGWVTNQVYTFTLDLTDTSAIIMIDGDTIFDVQDSFTSGRFGFYNYSQAQVKYTSFTTSTPLDFTFTPDPTCVDEPTEFFFDTNFFSNIESWTWTFDNGTTVSDIANAAHTYQSTGTFEVTLEATDFNGFSCSVSKMVTVDSICAEPEICDDGLDNDGDGLTDCEDADCFCFCNGGLESFFDPFDGNELDTSWVMVSPLPDNDVSLTGTGQLRVETLGGALNPIGNPLLQTAPRVYYPVTPGADWTIETRVQFDPDNSEDWQAAGLIALGNEDPTERQFRRLVQRVYNYNSPGHGIQMAGQFFPTTATDVYLRVTLSGVNYDCYYSLDGNNWNLLGTANLGIIGDVHYVGVFVENADSPTVVPSIATFDYFNLEGCDPAPSDPCDDLNQGMIAHYPFDESADDLSGNNHHGSETNSPAYTSGKIGASVLLDGMDDYVTVDDSPDFTLSDQPFTIALWVNFNELDNFSSFIAHDEGSGEFNKWIFARENGNLSFHINGPAPAYPNDGLYPIRQPWTPNVNEWYHVALTRSGSDYKAFVNGSLYASGTDSTPIPDPATWLTIGWSENDFYLNGSIDDLRFYGRSVSPDEILALYEGCDTNFEICDDGMDNDGDGLTDCEDADCFCFCNGGAETFFDPYDGTNLGTDWVVVSPLPDNDVSLTGTGQLRVETLGGALNPIGNPLLQTAPRVYYPVTPGSNWTIETRVQFDPDNSEDWQAAGLITLGNSDPTERQFRRLVQRVYNYNSPGHGIQMAGQFFPTTATDVYLRVTLSGVNYDCYYSLDGSNWNLLGTANLGIIGDVHYVGIFVENADNPTVMPSVATFDYFNLEGCGEPPSDPCDSLVTELNHGLTAHYPFDDNYADESGNGNDGTPLGQPIFEAGINGTAIYLDGDDDHIDLGNDLNFDDTFTVVGWVKWQNAGHTWQNILAKYETNGFGPYAFSVNNDRLNMWISNGSSGNTNFNSNHVMQEDEWVHVIFEGDNQMGRIYVNGVLDVESNIPPMTQNGDLVTIGRQALSLGNNHGDFKGTIDGMRIYDRLLTDDEKSALVNNCPFDDAPCAGGEIFSDPFDGTDLDTTWTVVNPNAPAGSTVSLTGGGQLSITMDVPFQDIMTKILRPVNPITDWTVYTKLSLSATTNNHGAGIVGVTDSNINSTNVVRLAELVQAGLHTVQSFVYPPLFPGFPPQVLGMSVPYSDNTVDFKVEKQGMTYESFYSSDGGMTWVSLGAMVIAEDILYLGLYGVNPNEDGPTGSALFDFYQIESCGTAPDCSGFTVTTVTTPELDGMMNGTATAVVAGNTGSVTYEWNTVPAQTTATATSLSAGTYQVTVMDSIGCMALSEAIIGMDTTDCVSSDSLLAWFPLDGNSIDLSGNDYHGTVEGPVLTEDRFGNPNGAYLFDGIDDYIHVPLNINPSQHPQLTITAWAKANDATPIRQVVSHDDGGYDRTLGIDHRGGGEGWSAFSGTGTVLGFQPVELGEWTFLAVTYDQINSTVKLYVNDTLLFEEIGSMGEGHDFLRIGSNPNFVEFFDGAIDDVKIYNRVLFENEITALATSCEEIDCAGFSISLTATPEMECMADGTATASVSGSSGAVIYQWNTNPIQTTATATGLTAGIYTVSATDSLGCTAVDSIEVIAEFTFTTETAVTAQVTCNGSCNGMAEVQVTGCTGPYEYLWTDDSTGDSVSGLCPDTYYVTVTDALGNMIVDSVVITQPPVLGQTIEVTDASCENIADGQVIAQADGGTPPFQFSLNGIMGMGNTFDSLSAGNYELITTDSIGCTITDSLMIGFEETLPSADFSSDTMLLSVTFTDLSSTNTFSWLWDFGDGQSSNLQNPAHVYDTAGTYIVCLIVSNDCGQDTICMDVTIETPNAVWEVFKNSIKAYPNPTKGQLFLEFHIEESLPISLFATDVAGKARQVIFKEKAIPLGFHRESLQVNDWPAGVYLLTLQSPRGIWTERIVVLNK